MIKKLIWIGIITVLLIYSVPKLLEQFSLFIENLNNDTDDSSITASFVMPPIIDYIPNATNSAQIQVSGYAEQADRVKIFINDISKKDIRVKSTDSSFSTKVPLFQGVNKITLVAYDEDGNTSEKTSPANVTYIANEPDLIIDSPTQDQEIIGDNPNIEVRGITDTKASVTVNGRWVRIKSDGTFTYAYKLDEGDNELEIVAKDPAGNISTSTISVRYSK